MRTGKVDIKGNGSEFLPFQNYLNQDNRRVFIGSASQYTLIIIKLLNKYTVMT